MLYIASCCCCCCCCCWSSVQQRRTLSIQPVICYLLYVSVCYMLNDHTTSIPGDTHGQRVLVSDDRTFTSLSGPLSCLCLRFVVQSALQFMSCLFRWKCAGLCDSKNTQLTNPTSSVSNIRRWCFCDRRIINCSSSMDHGLSWSPIHSIRLPDKASCYT